MTTIEYITYNFDSTSVHWTLVSEDLTKQANEGGKHLFGEFKTRNLKEDESLEEYITFLKNERTNFSSIRILVLGQPVIYKNFYGDLVKDHPFGIFLSFLSSKKFYYSLNAKNILATKSLTVKIILVPLGKVSYLTNIFTYGLN